MAKTDISNPPIVPAARGNQKASLPSVRRKGMKPRTVERTVRKMGITFTFHALTNAWSGKSFGRCSRIRLYSFKT